MVSATLWRARGNHVFHRVCERASFKLLAFLRHVSASRFLSYTSNSNYHINLIQGDSFQITLVIMIYLTANKKPFFHFIQTLATQNFHILPSIFLDPLLRKAFRNVIFQFDVFFNFYSLMNFHYNFYFSNRHECEIYYLKNPVQRISSATEIIRFLISACNSENLYLGKSSTNDEESNDIFQKVSHIIVHQLIANGNNGNFCNY